MMMNVGKTVICHPMIDVCLVFCFYKLFMVMTGGWRFLLLFTTKDQFSKSKLHMELGDFPASCGFPFPANVASAGRSSRDGEKYFFNQLKTSIIYVFPCFPRNLLHSKIFRMRGCSSLLRVMKVNLRKIVNN